MKKFIKIVVSLFVSLYVFSGISVQAASLEEIKEKGELVVGLNAEYPPFEWVQMNDGEPQIIGIDVALGQLIADKIGVELVIDNRSFDSLIPTLQTNKIDLIISGMAHTPERAEQIDFSVPYFQAVSQFAVAQGEADQYQSLEDFNGKKIAVLQGSIQETFVRDNMPEAELVSISKNGDLLEAIKAKKADALLMSDLSLAQYLETYQDSVELVDSFEVENEGIGSSVAMTKGNTELLEVVNQVITEAQESGQMDDIFAEYTELAGQQVTE